MLTRQNRFYITLSITGIIAILWFAWTDEILINISANLQSLSGSNWSDAVFIFIGSSVIVLLLFWVNFKLLDHYILSQHLLYRHILSTDNPQMDGVIFLLRHRARKTLNQGRVALFGTICLIFIVIGFLVSTIQVSEVSISGSNDSDKLQLQRANIESALTELEGLLVIEPLYPPSPTKFVTNKGPTIIVEGILKMAPFDQPTDAEISEAIVLRKKEIVESAVKNELASKNESALARIDPGRIRSDPVSNLFKSYYVQNGNVLLAYKARLIGKKTLVEAQLINAEKNRIRTLIPDPGLNFQSLQSILTRFGAVLVVLFLTQILVGLYRYSLRISAFYDSRADMLEIFRADADGVLSDFGVIGEIMSPDNYDFGKSPNSPAGMAVGLAKEIARAGRKVDGRAK